MSMFRVASRTILVGLTVALAVPAGAEESRGERFVGPVRGLVDALDKEDFESFRALFAKRTRGMQPDELWRSARGLLAKFGKIRAVEFSSLNEDEDSGGAYVKVQFERATREVFVRLNAEDKIRQLLYVPPTPD